MSHNNEYSHDVFISYAHADNKSGWVTVFKKCLEEWLNQRRLDIFIDYDELSGNRLLDGELYKHITASATLFIILSNNYIESDWCRQEVDWFRKIRSSFAEDGSIFVIRMEPINVELSSGLKKLERLLGYDFYNRESELKKAYCWPDGYYAKHEQAEHFRNSIRGVVSDLGRYLKQKERHEEQRPAVTSRSGSDKTTSVLSNIILSPLCYRLNKETWKNVQRYLKSINLSVSPSEEELEIAIQDYSKLVELFKRNVDTNSIYMQIADAQSNFEIPSLLKSEKVSLEDEWKYYKEKVQYAVLWLNPEFLSSRKSFSDEILPEYYSFVDRLTKSEQELVIQGELEELKNIAHRVLRSVEDNDIPQICLDFKNEESEAAEVLIEIIEKFFDWDCDVETLSDKDEETILSGVTDAKQRVHNPQQDIYQKLTKSRFVILLKKNRTNQDLFKRIKDYKQILNAQGGPELKSLPGAVAIFPEGASEAPGGFRHLKKLDFTHMYEDLKTSQEALSPRLSEELCYIKNSVEHQDMDNEKNRLEE